MNVPWKEMLGPSLVRRLVVAQMVCAALLWCGLSLYVDHRLASEGDEGDLMQMQLGAETVLPLAGALSAQPELLFQTLKRLNEFQRANVPGNANKPGLQLPRIYLWRDGALVYRSPDAGDAPAVERLSQVQLVSIKGQSWRAYAQESSDGRSRFLALAPATGEAAGLTPWSRGWLVLPLLVSLPLLMLPAWLSVRFAIRPLAQLAAEISVRAAQDLSPLHFAPPQRELQPVRQAMNGWLARLRDARERERHFIADAAHELRTPIAAISVHAEALRARSQHAEDASLLDGLMNCTARATRLVVQLLALARSSASTECGEPGKVNLGALTQEAMAQWAPVAREQQVELELHCTAAPWVEGHEESLRMLLDNLIGNAIKFSPPEGCVSVHLSSDGRRGRLYIDDQGPGIAPELRKRVFDRFYRVPGRSQPGSGLGLAIVQSVAQSIGAEVVLEEAPSGTGLRARVDFPAVMAARR